MGRPSRRRTWCASSLGAVWLTNRHQPTLQADARRADVDERRHQQADRRLQVIRAHQAEALLELYNQTLAYRDEVYAESLVELPDGPRMAELTLARRNALAATVPVASGRVRAAVERAVVAEVDHWRGLAQAIEIFGAMPLNGLDEAKERISSAVWEAVETCGAAYRPVVAAGFEPEPFEVTNWDDFVSRARNTTSPDET